MITDKKKRLEEIWKNYIGKFKDSPEIKKLIDYGFVHSIVDSKKNILFTGINPSYNGDPRKPDSFEAHDFDVHEAVTGYKKYYKKFQDIANHCGIGKEWTYLDLFYFRATKQRNIDMLLKNGTSLKFLCEQLILTQEIIEQLNPKLIVVFNKGSHEFLGKNANEQKDEHIWMGYEFKDAKIDGMKNDKSVGELKYISGLIDSKGRISKEKVTKTKLKGTLVYF